MEDNKLFIERLVNQLNSIKEKYNPMHGAPFQFHEINTTNTDKDNQVELKLTFEDFEPVITIVWYYKIESKEMWQQFYQEFIDELLLFMLFFKDTDNVKSIQTLIKTIKIYGH